MACSNPMTESGAATGGAANEKTDAVIAGVFHDLLIPDSCATEQLRIQHRNVKNMIDDLIRWRLRGSYLHYLLSNTPDNTNRGIRNYYSARWMEIHGRGSPSGQIKRDCTGGINSLMAAKKLSLALGGISQRHFGRLRRDVLVPRCALGAIHGGYKSVLREYQRFHDGGNFVSIETVCQAIIDLHRAANARFVSGRHSDGRGNLANCANRRCPGHHLPMIHHHTSQFLSSCPWCGHHFVAVPYSGDENH